MGSLYVGDLHHEINEAGLFEKFASAGTVLSIRVCRDLLTRRSLGYAYVNFQHVADAERALDTMNFDLIRQRPMRIMWSQRDPSLRRSGIGNVFIKNLDKTINNKAMFDTFSAFGNILSCKVVIDEKGNSKGYGFVHFQTEEAANTAIEKVNGKLLNGKKIFVGPFMSRKKRELVLGDKIKRFTNLYIKNFEAAFNEDNLKELFEPFGKITSAKIMTDDSGKSKGFAFVAYETYEAAQAAVENLHGKTLTEGKELYVAPAQKKADRQQELKRKFEDLKRDRDESLQSTNVYVKNLDDTFDDERLRAQFASYGNITSAKVMTDEQGHTKGFGFVCFSSPQEAAAAIKEQSGRIAGSKPLYVAMAQKKADRQAHLTALYMRRLPEMRVPPFGQIMHPAPMNTFYVPTIPSCQRFFPPHMAAPIRNSSRWMPQVRHTSAGGIVVPPGGSVTTPHGVYHNDALSSSYSGAYRPYGGVTTMGPRGPSQTVPRGRGIRYSTGRPAVAAHMHLAKQAISVGHPRSTNYSYTPSYIRNLPSVPVQNVQQDANNPDRPNIANMTHAEIEQKKQMLGERLFPIVKRLNAPLAAKITGMLLEMEYSELLRYLDDTEALKIKVEEAVAVLEAHSVNEQPPLK